MTADPCHRLQVVRREVHGRITPSGILLGDGASGYSEPCASNCVHHIRYLVVLTPTQRKKGEVAKRGGAKLSLTEEGHAGVRG